MLKAIWDKLLIGAGGAIAGAIILYLSSWSASHTPLVEASWTRVQLPRVDIFALEEIKKQSPLLERLFRTNAIPDLIESTRYERTVLIVQARVSNRSNQVLKQIEIKAKDQLFSMLYGQKGSEKTVAIGRLEPIVIPPLSPGDSVEIVFLAKEQYTSEVPLSALHDNKLVSVRQQTVDRDILGMVSFFIQNEFLLFLLVLAALFGVFLLLLAIFIWINRNNFPLQVKMNSVSDLERHVRLVDYIRKEHRHILPDSLKDAPPKALEILTPTPPAAP